MIYAQRLRRIDEHMARAHDLSLPAPRLVVERFDLDGNWWLNGLLQITCREITESDRMTFELAKERIINRALGAAA